MTHARSGIGKCRRGLALSGLLLLLILGSGCEDDSQLGFEVSCITFVPDAVPTPGEVVARLAANSSCDVAIVELIVTGVSDVWSANFEIDFPNQFALISQDLDVSESFLGDDALQVLEEIVPGTAECGVTRLDTQNNIGVTPDDTNNILAKVAFLRFVSSGSGALSLNDANLQIVSNPGDPPVGAVPAVPFRGGTLMIVNQIP